LTGEKGKMKLYDNYEVVSGRIFKLKDTPAERKFAMIELEQEFGQIPELIAIEKLKGKNNMFVVRAFVPKKEEKILTKDDTKVIKSKKTP
jgi:hypothetical protein